MKGPFDRIWKSIYFSHDSRTRCGNVEEGATQGASFNVKTTGLVLELLMISPPGDSDPPPLTATRKTIPGSDY